jgi:predicted kinase
MSDDMEFYGTAELRAIRATLDYTYHKNYTKERQLLQNNIVQKFLDDAVLIDQNGEVCTIPTMPWIVFTAGALGAGKGYTLNQLVQKGRFPLMAFVRVNPDDIRRLLPEFAFYIQEDPDNAGELTNKEAGYIAEILTLAGLRSGKNVIVDGSLRCSTWYRNYFARLRLDFPSLRIAIIHVTAPREAVFQRAAVSVCGRNMCVAAFEKIVGSSMNVYTTPFADSVLVGISPRCNNKERAIHTKRIVPRELLEEALEQVPRSVRELSPLVDYHVELRNETGAADIELVTPGVTWVSFTSQWAQ